MDTKYLMLVLLLIAAPFAHQPRFVIGYNLTLENPYNVVAPEVSKAYYGELSGKPDYYIIVAKDPFDLYVQVNSPLAPKEARRFSFEILDSSKQPIVSVYENQSKWGQWFEPFGGDWYLTGPEYKARMPAGIYYVKVYNEENRGKYALVVGEKEEFPPNEAINAILLIPPMKQAFFGKDVVMGFLHLAGIVLALGAVSVIFLSGSVFSRTGKMSPKAVSIYYATQPVLIAGVIITVITWMLMYSQNPESIMATVKSVVLGVLVLLALALVLLVNPKPDEKTERSNVKLHGPIVLFSFCGWWLLLLLTVAMV
ncbi:MAG: hypothetical protein N3G76_02510 [Candidatus Micrarchaeota archaeon]|nr:hypothetical protein [Candidatus Micrarchaeota archaeon]